MFAAARSATLIGVEAAPVRVEADLGPGLQAFRIVGLAEGAVRESRVRVKSAIENSGFRWPLCRVSLNLAPADLRKEGTALDLPVALALLGATGAVPAEALGRWMAAAELSLDGRLRPVRGVLPMAIAAREVGARGLLVAPENGSEAALVPGLEVVACATLRDAVERVRGQEAGERVPHAAPASAEPATLGALDLAEVRGQEGAKRALEVAAAGGHNLLFVGPPGSGKTMLARRMAGILPAMTFEEALEVTRIHSVAGLTLCGGLVTRRPFRAPHHTISDVGIVGGGSGLPRPGEISLAHQGVLFLDELPEFRRSALEVMRQPLEAGVVELNRSLHALRYPARVLLVASMNPCPCGHLGDPKRPCVDTPQQVERYRARLSGPLLDRIDLHVEVPAVPYEALRDRAPGESSATVRGRVEAARALQRARGMGGGCNAELDGRGIRAFCRLDAAGHRLLARAVDRWGMSARACDRVLKVARTIADLAQSEVLTAAHVAEAIGYRALDRGAVERAEPL